MNQGDEVCETRDEPREPIAEFKLKLSLKLTSSDEWNENDTLTRRLSGEREFVAYSVHQYGWIVGLHAAYLAEDLTNLWEHDKAGFASGVAGGLREVADLIENKNCNTGKRNER